MARPQGIHSPLMVPYGPSIEVATSGDSTTGFNTVTSNGSDGNETNLINLTSPGFFLGLGFSAGGASFIQFIRRNISFDGIVSTDLLSNNISLMGGFNQNNDKQVAYTPFLCQFASSLDIRIWNTAQVSGAPDNNPNWASAWYCTKLVPHIIGSVQHTETIDYEPATADTYTILLDVSGGGGQCLYLEVSNSNTLGILQTFLKLTIDGVVKEYDLSKFVMIPNIQSGKRGIAFPFSFRWNDSFKVEIKDTQVITGTHRAGVTYSLDA